MKADSAGELLSQVCCYPSPLVRFPPLGERSKPPREYGADAALDTGDDAERLLTGHEKREEKRRREGSFDCDGWGESGLNVPLFVSTSILACLLSQ